MLQQVEYDSYKFADWVDGAPDLTKIQRRQKLDITARVKITLIVAYILWGLPLLAGLYSVAFSQKLLWLVVAAFAPLFCVIGLFVFNGFFGALVVKPRERAEVAAAAKKLKNMGATKIAVLGSYGKTTMKDILHTILNEGIKTSATPGNKNVLISHARWVAKQLDGDEKALIFEYGEAEPGDIKQLSRFSQPDVAVITGLAPAHMDGYDSLDAIGADFQTIHECTPAEAVFINAESTELASRVKGTGYSHKEVDGWKISGIKVSLDGLSFTMKKGRRVIKLTSKLLGKHNIGPLAAAAAIAARLGLNDKQIAAGVAKTAPFEHRMQPYNIGSATIIDDTYNGNIDGMKAGLELLKQLPAKRKIYITPGLVEQGSETSAIHQELGKSIAKANPDKVILMQNSAAADIQAGLQSAGYSGEVAVEPEPLTFYSNLQHIVAAGDLVLMQNDWTDNYF